MTSTRSTASKKSSTTSTTTSSSTKQDATDTVKNNTSNTVTDDSTLTPPTSMPSNIRIAYFLILLTSLLSFFHLVPVYVHMMIVTVSTIYIGSVCSVRSHADDTVQTEQMQTKDVYMFPVIGSAVLFSLYLVFKFLPKDYVNLVIKAYFFVFGLAVLTAKIHNIIASLLPYSMYQSFSLHLCRCRNPVDVIEKAIECVVMKMGFGKEKKDEEKKDEETKEDEKTVKSPKSSASKTPPPTSTHFTLTPLDLLSFALAFCISVTYILTNHWFVSNIFGIAFSVQGIELLSLGSYMNGVILLSGLFFYDIFWVFGTDVMVTVAKSFDAPIKLLFPQASYMVSGKLNASMLGLGDIVIPGIFIALLLRFDFAMCKQRQTVKNDSQQSEVKRRRSSSTPHAHLHAPQLTLSDTELTSTPKPYFLTTLFAYFIGLTTTVQVMYWFEAAQPALLYLVPACLGASWLVGVKRGELKQLFKYTEGESEEEKKDEKKTQ